MSRLPDTVIELTAGIAGPEAEDSVVSGEPLRERALFRRYGDFWTIEYRRTRTCIRDCLGMQYIAELLRHPGEDLLALDLAIAARGQPSVTASIGQLDSEATRICADVSGAPLDPLDPRTRSIYTQCLRDLRVSLDESESFNDAGLTSQIREKKELLARELARRLRPRTPAKASVERARVRVTRSIKATMRKIAALHSRLGEHFAATIRTGTFCVYRPDPRAPISWEL